jgi:hypothetical protein
MPRPRSGLHRYQHDAVAFLTADAEARQLIAVMGSGKTAISLHAVADLKAAGQLSDPVLVVAPLMIAETVWHAEARLWADTAGLRIVRIIGTPRQRLAALNCTADVYVINYDNLHWLAEEVIRRRSVFSVLIADESSKLKTPTARRTKVMLALGGLARRRWTMTGTPRGQQLLDVWAPAQLVTRGQAFPPFYAWRNANFVPVDLYQRQWQPRPGVEAAAADRLRPFTHVVDQAALNTRPPVVEVVHDVPLDLKSAAIYEALDPDGVADAVAAKAAAGLLPASEMAVVTKLMQVCSGAVSDDHGGWRRLHDRRLDALAEIHEAHDRPTLVFVGFRHEAERIRERFPFAQELTADRIDAWNAGEIEMLVAHPASAGHGVNLQHGSDTLVWFSLPWSAELYAQANARLARQGQTGTVSIHILLSRRRIDEIAYRVVRRRLAEQQQLVEALA